VRIKTFLALALASAVSISAAVATTLDKMDLSELTKKAPVAVVGTVTASRTAQTAAGVVTIATVSVANSIWGTSAATLDVEIPGGAISKSKYRVAEVNAGAPALLSGQKALLLLTPVSGSGNFQIVGYNQGMFAVVNDAVMLPNASRAMPLAAAMSEIRAARAQPESSNGLR
jgi:hypothetical protein